MTDSKKEVTVYQANPLVEGRREFTKIETRLFYLGLRDVVPKLPTNDSRYADMGQEDFPITKIKPSELISLFGNDTYYGTLEEICYKLAEKTVKVKRVDKKGYAVYPVFSKLEYIKGEGLILEFNRYMKPWLLELADKQFTKIPFEQILELNSPYAVRLLELLLQYKNTKTHERTIRYEELRYYLGADEIKSYNRVDIFRQRVIDSSIKEINENTSYKVEYEKIKDGRKIVGFKFKLHLPAELKAEKQKQKAKEALDIVAGLAQSKSMTPGQNNAPPALSKKRPMPVFLDKDGKRLEYEKPVRIKDGKVIV